MRLTVSSYERAIIRDRGGSLVVSMCATSPHNQITLVDGKIEPQLTLHPHPKLVPRQIAFERVRLRVEDSVRLAPLHPPAPR